MASPQEHISMALFCDFENVALGVRDAQFDKFDIKRVLERLLLKGSIVVKKAYCDWERYKGFKATMHEANFELIEIPHVRQSGKNSADIRLVVDALDLCYTKSHVNTFVIISGDSDFSPLVSKLRENAKHVIGVGVKQSTSDLLIANCDEFIFYDDLVRESQRMAARRNNEGRDAAPAPRRSPEEESRRREEMEVRRSKAVEMAAETYEALVTDRDEGGRIWASVLKEAIKRRNPGFNEGFYGFRTFGNLLEEAQSRGLLEFGRDEKSGAYVYRGGGVNTTGPTPGTSLVADAPQGQRPSPSRHEFMPTAFSAPPAQPGSVSGAQSPEGHDDAGLREREPSEDAAPSPRSERGGRGRGRGTGRSGRAENAGTRHAPASAPDTAPEEPSAAADIAPSRSQAMETQDRVAMVAAELMRESEDEDDALQTAPAPAAAPARSRSRTEARAPKAAKPRAPRKAPAATASTEEPAPPAAAPAEPAAAAPTGRRSPRSRSRAPQSTGGSGSGA